MKIARTFLSGCMLIACSPAFSGEAVDVTRPVTSDGYVRVNVVRGELQISGWDRDVVQVVGELDDQAEKLVFEVSGNETVIAVRLPRDTNRWCCGQESDLEVMIPRNSSLNVSVVSTDLEVSNISGGIEVGGVSGDITVSDVVNRIRVSNVSGEVTLRKAKGRKRVKTVSGDIEAADIEGPSIFHSVSGSVRTRGTRGELDLESVSGDIEVTESFVSGVRGHSVSGDVELETKLAEAAVVEFDSMSGSIRLRLEGNVSGRFDLETGSGSIRNRMTEHRPRESEFRRDETLRFSVGDGDAEVMLSTGSGDIVLSRQ